MPGEEVPVASRKQQLIYDRMRYYFDKMTEFLTDNEHAGARRLVGVVADDTTRILNGRVYPRFERAVDYTRYLRHCLTFEQHLVHDIDVWSEIMRTVADAQIQHVLVKIFLAFKHSNFVWKAGQRSGNMDSWGTPSDAGSPYPWNLASALSHGSRVCIVVPKSTHTGFRKWLTCDAMARGFGSKIFHRLFGISTHRAVPVRTDHGVDVNETKAKINTGAYGINLAPGVLGGPSPIQGRTLRDDGSCGHLYIYESDVTNLGSFFSPDKYKIMMIGIEASYGSGHDLYGSWHGTGPEQNGTGVGIYWHNNVGGPNRNHVGMNNLPGGNRGHDHVPAKYGGMVVRDLRSMTELNGQYQVLRDSGGWASLLSWVPANNIVPVPVDDFVLIDRDNVERDQMQDRREQVFGPNLISDGDDF